MSLRAKLVVALVVCTSLASGAVGALSYRATAQRLDAEIDGSLAAAVSGVEREIATGRRGAAGRALGGPREIDLQLVTAEGQTIGPGASIPVDRFDRELATESVAGVERFRDDSMQGAPVRILSSSIGDSAGAIQAARSLEETRRVLAALGSRILAVVAAVAVVAAAAGWLIAVQVTRRLTSVTSAAERVAETGALDVAVPVEGNDESARLGTAFNEMLAALAQSRADQQRLVQDAGHELRTPMTSLRTNLYTLRNLEELGADERAMVLADLESETEELSQLIDEVVEVATDRRGDEPLVEVDLGLLTSRVAERASARRGRAVSVGVHGDTVVLGRRESLGRAVRNLVDNACKFDRSSAPVEVTVEESAPGPQRPGGVSIAVLDRGPGIHEADLPHVFERFYRAADARSEPGSGLGLAIVAEIVAAHGGACAAEPRPGGGAVVSFWLPSEPPETLPPRP